MVHTFLNSFVACLSSVRKQNHAIEHSGSLEAVVVFQKSGTMRTFSFGARKRSETVHKRTVHGTDVTGFVRLETALLTTVGSTANENKVPDSKGWRDYVCESLTMDNGSFAAPTHRESVFLVCCDESRLVIFDFDYLHCADVLQQVRLHMIYGTR